MYLEFDEIEKANRVRDLILKATPLSTLDLCKCRKCKGTGLEKVYYNHDGTWTSWDGSSYCEFCKGVGYHNPADIDKSLYRCSICNGEGFVLKQMEGFNNPFPKECPHCKGFGFINWLENLFGKQE